MPSFSDLPAEIYDEIYSHLREECTAAYFREQPTPQKADSYEYTRKIFRACDYVSQPALYNLRLVSKALHYSATRFYFKHAMIPFHCFKTGSFLQGIGMEQNIARLIEEKVLNQGVRLSSVLRRAKIEFGDQVHDWPPNENFFGSQRSETYATTFLEFMQNLPYAFSKLEKLQCLSINVPGEWESVFGGYGETDHGPTLDLEMLALLRKGLSSMFATCSFDFLTDLRLTLPCTYDFMVLNNSLSDDFVNRLRHLYLGIMDASGPGGSTQYLFWHDEDRDGDENCPSSNLQAEYPNTEHAIGIFNIVKRCPKLESLGLSGTQRLDLDLLDWQTEQGLQCLYFYRGTITAANLIRLLSSSVNISGPNPLFSIWLEDIEMTSGTWSEVFKYLMTCPSLSYLNPADLMYAREGESSHFKVFNYRPWEDGTNIWTAHEDDEIHMVQLLEKLIDKAGGQENYPDDHGETMNVY